MLSAKFRYFWSFVYSPGTGEGDRFYIWSELHPSFRMLRIISAHSRNLFRTGWKSPHWCTFKSKYIKNAESLVHNWTSLNITLLLISYFQSEHMPYIFLSPMTWDCKLNSERNGNLPSNFREQILKPKLIGNAITTQVGDIILECGRTGSCIGGCYGSFFHVPGPG